MNIAITSLHLVAIAWFAFLLWRKGRERIFWSALAFKLVCGILIGLLYRYYYTSGDTWNFFNEGTRVATALMENPKLIFGFFWNDQFQFEGFKLFDARPRSLYFLKWVTAFNLLSAGSYWITALYFSFISFLGSWYLFKILTCQFPTLRMEVAISILFVPSVVLWGSGVIKESIAIGFLFLLSGAFIDWYYNRELKAFQIFSFLLSCWVLWSLKYYWLAIWLAVTLPVVAVIFLQPRLIWVKRYPKWTWLVLLLCSIGGVSSIHPNFYFYRIFAVIAENHDAFVAISDPEDLIQYSNLNSSIWSILVNSPWALFSALFRPFVFEARTVLQVAASMENIVLLVLLGLSVYRFRREPLSLNLMHYALIGYIVLLGVFLALSTPNFGTLSRFRIGFTPFLWFGLLSASGLVTKIIKRKSS
jgi:hypothetical protein